MTLIPSASCGSINSRSNNSIKTSRFPGCSVYCLNSTTGQQSCVCFKLSTIGSVMTHLSTLGEEMKKAEAESPAPVNCEQALRGTAVGASGYSQIAAHRAAATVLRLRQPPLQQTYMHRKRPTM
jgi:hypothetical protein